MLAKMTSNRLKTYIMDTRFRTSSTNNWLVCIYTATFHFVIYVFYQTVLIRTAAGSEDGLHIRKCNVQCPGLGIVFQHLFLEMFLCHSLFVLLLFVPSIDVDGGIIIEDRTHV